MKELALASLLLATFKQDRTLSLSYTIKPITHCGMRLTLGVDQDIRMISPDNKAMKARCTKLLHNEAALDLLPRVRYMIDLEYAAPVFVPSARLLFDLGLHLVPVVKPGTQEVTNIVAINLSDKIIRMFNGMSLSDEDYLSSPSGSRSSDEDMGRGAHLQGGNSDSSSGYMSNTLEMEILIATPP